MKAYFRWPKSAHKEMVLKALGRLGEATADAVGRSAGMSLSKTWDVIKDLRKLQLVEKCGKTRNPDPRGGRPLRVWRLSPMGARFLIQKEKIPETLPDFDPEDTPLRRTNGSGVIASRITVGRGSRWM